MERKKKKNGEENLKRVVDFQIFGDPSKGEDYPEVRGREEKTEEDFFSKVNGSARVTSGQTCRGEKDPRGSREISKGSRSMYNPFSPILIPFNPLITRSSRVDFPSTLV